MERKKRPEIHLTRQFRRIQNEIDNDKSRLMFVRYAERRVVRPTWIQIHIYQFNGEYTQRRHTAVRLWLYASTPFEFRLTAAKRREKNRTEDIMIVALEELSCRWNVDNEDMQNIRLAA